MAQADGLLTYLIIIKELNDLAQAGHAANELTALHLYGWLVVFT